MSIKVSVCCTTYNHERYLEKCLDSLVCQKTNFPFEILVFEDCSTDSTKEILSRYAKKYPDLIIPLYQEQNRYSKDIHVCENYVFPLVLGEYVSLCEVDDYWTDENKLQKQVDALDLNPDCSFCAHRVALVGDNCESLNDNLPRHKTYTGVYTPDNFIELGYCHTTCYMLKTSVLKEYLSTGLYKTADVFDVPILNYFAQVGNTYFIDETMSAYRCARVGNWTQNHNAHSHGTSMLETIDAIDAHFDKKWTKSLDKYRFDEKILVCFREGHFKEIKGKRWKRFVKALPNKKLKLKIYLDFAFPCIVELLNKRKNKKK